VHPHPDFDPQRVTDPAPGIGAASAGAGEGLTRSTRQSGQRWAGVAAFNCVHAASRVVPA
jgi:hypothetical protein